MSNLDDTSILIGDRGGYVGQGDVVETASKGFAEALAMLRPATAAVTAEIQALAKTPDEVQLELGFSLKAEVGVVIARIAAEGSFKLTLKWKARDGGPSPAAPA